MGMEEKKDSEARLALGGASHETYIVFYKKNSPFFWKNPVFESYCNDFDQPY